MTAADASLGLPESLPQQQIRAAVRRGAGLSLEDVLEVERGLVERVRASAAGQRGVSEFRGPATRFLPGLGRGAVASGLALPFANSALLRTAVKCRLPSWRSCRRAIPGGGTEHSVGGLGAPRQRHGPVSATRTSSAGPYGRYSHGPAKRKPQGSRPRTIARGDQGTFRPCAVGGPRRRGSWRVRTDVRTREDARAILGTADQNSAVAGTFVRIRTKVFEGVASFESAWPGEGFSGLTTPIFSAQRGRRAVCHRSRPSRAPTR